MRFTLTILIDSAIPRLKLASDFEMDFRPRLQPKNLGGSGSPDADAVNGWADQKLSCIQVESEDAVARAFHENWKSMTWLRV